MRLLMKIALLFCFLTVVYQYSQCSYLPKLSYSEILKEKRSIDKQTHAAFNEILGYASSNVRAYSNGNDTYYSGQSSYLYGVYMGLKWQCVEFARRWTFIRKGSVFESVEGANDMWNQLKNIERVADKQQFPLKQHSNGSPYPPINESYLIYPIQKDMPYGHVAVIVDVLPNSIRIAEQNFYFHYWSHNYAREIPLVFRDGLYYINDQYEVYGWIEIDDNQQLKPLDRTTAAEIKERSLTSSSSSILYKTISVYFFHISLLLTLKYQMNKS